MTIVEARAVEFQGRSFTVPAATVALADGERLALATVTGNAFHYGGQRIAYSLEPGAVDLSAVRGDRGAPLLIDHMFLLSSFIGNVFAASLEGDSLRLLCRFARTPAATEVWELLSAGFPLSISAGGEIGHAEQAGDGLVRALRWKLVEVSVCVRGRDEAASVRRLETDESADEMVRRMNVDDPDGLGRRVALRRRLRLDDWRRWSKAAGPRLARKLGVDIDEATEALAEEVAAHVREIEVATL